MISIRQGRSAKNGKNSRSKGFRIFNGEALRLPWGNSQLCNFQRAGKALRTIFLFGFIAVLVSCPMTPNPGPDTPTADAGENQSATPRITVTLDGSDSEAATTDITITSYEWELVGSPPAGATIDITNDTTTPTATFTTPSVSADLTLEFRLTVTDSNGKTASDTVVVTVSLLPPAVNAGRDQSLAPMTDVTLSGSGNTSITGITIAGYRWEQIGNPSAENTVTLMGTMTDTATFTTPNVSAEITLEFRFTVTDSNGKTASDTVDIIVSPSPRPIARAGEDRAVDLQSDVTLDGSGSIAVTGDPIASYRWEQIGNPSAENTVTLMDAMTDTATFEAPSVTAGTTITLEFRITVTADSGTIDSDTVIITVTPRVLNRTGIATLMLELLQGVEANDHTVRPMAGEEEDLTVDLSVDPVMGMGGSFEGDIFMYILNITGGNGVNTFTGNAEANRFTGGRTADVFNGGDGNDTLTGGPGNDMLTGGEGSDTALYAISSPAPFVITSTGTAPDIGYTVTTGAETDTLSGIETIEFSAGNDTIGNLSMPLSDIVIDGGAGTDTIALTDDGVTFDLSMSPNYKNFETITGGTGADTITGTAGNETIHGGAGDDILKGSTGTDILDGGPGTDTVDFSGLSAEFRVNINLHPTRNYGTGGGLLDPSDSIPGITLGPQSAVIKMGLLERSSWVSTLENMENIRGSRRSNSDGVVILVGNDGPNRIESGSQPDIIRGNGGADTFVVSRGKVLSGGHGVSEDTIKDFVQGEDKLDLIYLPHITTIPPLPHTIDSAMAILSIGAHLQIYFRDSEGVNFASITLEEHGGTTLTDDDFIFAGE